MTTCGNNYISINGVKKCGAQDMSDPGNFINIEFAAGESVESEIKTDNAMASSHCKSSLAALHTESNLYLLLIE